jgi:hypothetical protein
MKASGKKKPVRPKLPSDFLTVEYPPALPNQIRVRGGQRKPTEAERAADHIGPTSAKESR